MEDVEKLKDFLAAPELPAWYLDADEPRWGKKHVRCRV